MNRRSFFRRAAGVGAGLAGAALIGVSGDDDLPEGVEAELRRQKDYRPVQIAQLYAGRLVELDTSEAVPIPDPDELRAAFADDEVLKAAAWEGYRESEARAAANAE